MAPVVHSHSNSYTLTPPGFAQAFPLLAARELAAAAAAVVRPVRLGVGPSLNAEPDRDLMQYFIDAPVRVSVAAPTFVPIAAVGLSYYISLQNSHADATWGCLQYLGDEPPYLSEQSIEAFIGTLGGQDRGASETLRSLSTPILAVVFRALTSELATARSTLLQSPQTLGRQVSARNAAGGRDWIQIRQLQSKSRDAKDLLQTFQRLKQEVEQERCAQDAAAPAGGEDAPAAEDEDDGFSSFVTKHKASSPRAAGPVEVTPVESISEVTEPLEVAAVVATALGIAGADQLKPKQVLAKASALMPEVKLQQGNPKAKLLQIAAVLARDAKAQREAAAVEAAVQKAATEKAELELEKVKELEKVQAQEQVRIAAALQSFDGTPVQLDMAELDRSLLSAYTETWAWLAESVDFTEARLQAELLGPRGMATGRRRAGSAEGYLLDLLDGEAKVAGRLTSCGHIAYVLDGFWQLFSRWAEPASGLEPDSGLAEPPPCSLTSRTPKAARTTSQRPSTQRRVVWAKRRGRWAEAAGRSSGGEALCCTRNGRKSRLQRTRTCCTPHPVRRASGCRIPSWARGGPPSRSDALALSRARRCGWSRCRQPLCLRVGRWSAVGWPGYTTRC